MNLSMNTYGIGGTDLAQKSAKFVFAVSISGFRPTLYIPYHCRESSDEIGIVGGSSSKCEKKLTIWNKEV